VFYGQSQFALIFGSDAGALMAHDFAIRIQKLLQDRDVFVIDMLYIVG